MFALESQATSKKPFQPQSGPISGLVQSLVVHKDSLRSLVVETLWGTFEAQIPKSIRAALAAELEPQMPVRLWLKVKGHKTKAVAIVPLEARQVIVTGPRDACIWVCSSKSCERRGGDEVLKSLQEAAQNQGLGLLKVKKCGCLGSCKKGPSLKVRGHKKVHQVHPKTAAQWLAGVLNRSSN